MILDKKRCAVIVVEIFCAIQIVYKQKISVCANQLTLTNASESQKAFADFNAIKFSRISGGSDAHTPLQP